MTMTHGYSICNSLALLIRYNDVEDLIEYRYSDEKTIGKSPIHYNEEGSPYFCIEGDEIEYYLDEFCRLNM